MSDPCYEFLVEHVPIALVVTDRAGRILLVNRKAEELFGHPR